MSITLFLIVITQQPYRSFGVEGQKDGIWGEAFRMGLDQFMWSGQDMFQVIGEVDSGSVAGRIDGPQDIEGGPAATGFSKLRGDQHTDFSPQAPFPTVICIVQARIAKVLQDFTTVSQSISRV